MRYGTMKGVFAITELTGTRYPSRPPDVGVLRKECLDSLKDAQHYALRRCSIVFGYIGAYRLGIVDRFRRPNWCHAPERLGAGRSWRVFHEPTHSLTA
jgi:hypothetical protein